MTQTGHRTIRSISFQIRVCLIMVLIGLSLPSMGQIKLIPNKGQWEPRILYRAEIPGGTFFLEKNALTYYFFDQYAISQDHHAVRHIDKVNCHVVRVALVGSTGASSVESGKLSQEYYSYFLGNDPSRWVSGIQATESIKLHEVWPGIDMEIRSSGSGIKYSFILKPKADPKLINLLYTGPDRMDIRNDSLVVKTTLGDMIEAKPVAYQEQKDGYKEIRADYKLADGVLSFDLGSYSRRKELVIDPVLIFSTYSGSAADNWGFTGTYDLQGNAYSGGVAFSNGFPTTVGAFQRTYQGGTKNDQEDEFPRDCAILKYTPDGTKVLWATYIGGKDNEAPHSMVVNSKGELVVMGTSRSSNFPTTAGAYQQINRGGYDIFVSKLSADGKTMVSSTLFGGSDRDGLNITDPKASPASDLAYNYGDQWRGEVIVDAADNVLVASCTQSSNFPILNSFQTTFNGIMDACLFKLTPDLSSLVFSALLGGRSVDAAYGLALDKKGNIIVCGGTESQDFPATFGVIGETPRGGVDGFVAKLLPSGALTTSTYIGTNKYDQVYLVQVDNFNRICINGQSKGNMPIIGNPYVNNRNGKLFIQFLSNDLTKVLKSTVFGTGQSTPDLSPSAFMVDNCGRIYFSGWGGRVNAQYNSDNDLPDGIFSLPTTPDAIQRTTDGSDFYLAIFAKDLSGFMYGTFYGGKKSPEHVDGGTSRFDPDGKIYQSVCGGCWGNSDLPTTPNAWSRKNLATRGVGDLPNDPNPQGGCNNAFLKIDLNSSIFAPNFKDTVIKVFATESIHYEFDIIDKDVTDSIYVSAVSKIFNPKLISSPVANFKADSGIGKVRAIFDWQTVCNHISADTYVVTVTARDNGCPTPRVHVGTIKIVVLPPPLPEPPAIFCLNRVNDHTLDLYWDDYKVNKYLAGYRLIKRWPDGHEEVLKLIRSEQDRSYRDENAQKHLTTDYRYFMYGVSICDGIGDSTRIISSIPDPDSIPKKVYMNTATVEQDQYVKVVWNRYTKEDFYFYQLFRKENNPRSQFFLYKTFRNFKDTVFNDSDVNVHQKSYVYKIVMRNQCGLESSDSNIATSILLSGHAIPFEHDLNWNPYQNWPTGVDHYEIYRRDLAHPQKKVGTVTGRITTYGDTSLDYDQGIYWYTVKAIQASGGEDASSLSNEIKLIQPPHLYVPNVFTPNGDSINDRFNFVPVFVKDFHLKVFNRWGEFVWETSDRHIHWDGLYHGNKPFDNVFIWQVEYTGWDESKHFDQGFVTLIW